ncbi:hypothetical protein GCM10020255_011230 [Rhodococcus baikonurensis]
MFDDLLASGLSGDEVAGLLVDRRGSGDGVADSGGYGLTDGAGVLPVGERVLGLAGDGGLVDVGDLNFDGFAESPAPYATAAVNPAIPPPSPPRTNAGVPARRAPVPAPTAVPASPPATRRFRDEDVAQPEADVSADGAADQCSSDGERVARPIPGECSGGGSAYLGGGVAAGFVDGDAEGVQPVATPDSMMAVVLLVRSRSTSETQFGCAMWNVPMRRVSRGR